MNKPTDMQPGAVVQLAPEADSIFGGALMIVDEVKPWGVQAYANVLVGGEGLRPAMYRAVWNDIELVGTAAWTQ